MQKACLKMRSNLVSLDLGCALGFVPLANLIKMFAHQVMLQLTWCIFPLGCPLGPCTTFRIVSIGRG